MPIPIMPKRTCSPAGMSSAANSGSGCKSKVFPPIVAPAAAALKPKNLRREKKLDFMVNHLLRIHADAATRNQKRIGQALFHRRRYDDVSKTYVSIYTALQVNRAGQAFVAI